MRRRLLFDRLPWQRSASSALIRYSRLLLHVCGVVRRTARFAQHGTVLRSVVLLIRIFYLHSSRLACFLTSVLFEHLSPTQPRYRQPTRVSRANVAVKMRKKKNRTDIPREAPKGSGRCRPDDMPLPNAVAPGGVDHRGDHGEW